MKSSVIREMSSAEIREQIENEKSMFLKLKMNHLVSNLENPIKLKYARKTIARLSTELTKRDKNSPPDSVTATSETKSEAFDAKKESVEPEVKGDVDNNKTK